MSDQDAFNTQSKKIPKARSIPADADLGVMRFTIATLVTDFAQYDAMRASFASNGFTDINSEFIYLDNTQGNQLDAYAALNRMWNEAHGNTIIFCHQDVRLIDDDFETLKTRLCELTRIDPNWAVAGNAGGTAPGELAIRITDPHMENAHKGELPARVSALDENFLIVQRHARFGCSANLEGYHFYGADLCTQADVAGYTSYVIDFHLHHLSQGNKSQSFFECQNAFEEKYAAAFRSRWIQTTCALVFVSGARLSQTIGGAIARPYAALLRRVS